jgi:hypothetical protein
VVLEGGTLTSSAAGFGRSPVRRHSGGVWNTDRAEHGVVGTLLGPEGADRLPGEPGAGRGSHVRAGRLSYRRCPRGDGRVWRWRVIGVWSYVENCTVDASIF